MMFYAAMRWIKPRWLLLTVTAAAVAGAILPAQFLWASHVRMAAYRATCFYTMSDQDPAGGVPLIRLAAGEGDIAAVSTLLRDFAGERQRRYQQTFEPDFPEHVWFQAHACGETGGSISVGYDWGMGGGGTSFHFSANDRRAEAIGQKWTREFYRRLDRQWPGKVTFETLGEPVAAPVWIETDEP